MEIKVKITDKIISLSQKRKIFINYASQISKKLKAKGIRMMKIKSDTGELFRSGCDQEKNPNIIMELQHYSTCSGGTIVGFLISTYYPSDTPFLYKSELARMIKGEIQKKINEKYPVTDLCILIDNRSPKRLEPPETIANQLYIALTTYNNAIESPEAISMREKAEKKIDDLVNRLIKREANKIIKSYIN